MSEQIKLHPLSQGLVATIDKVDYSRVSKLKWFAGKDYNTVYAFANITKPQGRRRLMMHQLISDTNDGEECDHIDGNGLNNCRSNLRACTHQQNIFHAKPYRNTSSQYKGVSWNKKAKRWIANIRLNNKVTYLGSYGDEVEAALAYNKAAEKLFGEYAYLNEVS